MSDLPAGYVELDGAAVHVATPRRYTTDVRRFMQFYPLCQELQQHEPGSEGHAVLVRSLTDDERKGVAVTMREAGQLYFALADSALAEVQRRHDR